MHGCGSEPCHIIGRRHIHCQFWLCQIAVNQIDIVLMRAHSVPMQIAFVVVGTTKNTCTPPAIVLLSHIVVWLPIFEDEIALSNN